MNKDLLRKTAFDADLSTGARNAVRTCLRIQPQEKVTLICDNACRQIAASMVSEFDALGVAFPAFLLEELAPRPLIDMPPQVLADPETSDVSIFTVYAQRNKLKTRMQMTEVVQLRVGAGDLVVGRVGHVGHVVPGGPWRAPGDAARRWCPDCACPYAANWPGKTQSSSVVMVT